MTDLSRIPIKWPRRLLWSLPRTIVMLTAAAAAAQDGADSVRSASTKDRVLALVQSQIRPDGVPVRVWGEIGEDLYRSGLARRVPQAVMAEFIRVLSYGVDFERDLRPADQFELAYVGPETARNGEVGAGVLLFAAITLKNRRLAVWRFRPADGRAEFFTADGHSIRAGLLRTPVDKARISSRFGMRKHPILGFTRMHKGVDFAAAKGTPVLAAGDGVVLAAAQTVGYGRLLRVRHGSGLVTLYAHLSAFAAGIGPGVRVRQGQRIGAVGATGLTTGPHLHYEVHRDGTPFDPATLHLAASRVLSGDEFIAFRWHAALLSVDPSVSPIGQERGRGAGGKGCTSC